MRVSKWGNSLAVRLPAAVVESLDLKEGDEIELKPSVDSGFEVVRKPDRIELIIRTGFPSKTARWTISSVR